MATRIRGITIELGGDTSGLEKALKDVNKDIRTTQNELKDVDRLLKIDPTNVTLLEQKQRLLGRAVAETTEKVETLRGAQKLMDDQMAQGLQVDRAQYDALQREIIATQNQLNGFSAQATEIDKTTSATKKMDAAMASAGLTAGKIRGSLVAMAAAAAVALGKASVSVIRLSDDLNTLSKQSGFSTADLQKFAYAADLVDVSQEAIVSSATKLRRAMASTSSETAEAFERIGVETRDATGEMRASSDVYYDVIAALGRIGNETERDALAMTLLGRSADELAGIIDDGGQALRKYGDEAERIGAILSQEDLDRLNEANDLLDTIKAKTSAWFRIGLADTISDYVRMFQNPGQYFADIGQNARDATTAIYNYTHYNSNTPETRGGGGGSFAAGGSDVNVSITFDGDLASLGAVLEPHVRAETQRIGGNLTTRD